MNNYQLSKERLLNIYDKWKEEINPNDRASLGALNYVQYLIDHFEK